VTTLARGKGRSIPVEDVLTGIRAAVRGGAQEVVLTGVQLGSWGQDLFGEPRLRRLVEEVLSRTEVPRVRLSSIEPWDVSRGLIELLTEERVARHLHLPLQSGSDPVLRRMGRPIRTADYAGLLEDIRRVSPDAAVTTDLMTGFPGETGEDFQRTVEFVRRMNFADGHVFTFSARPDTPAAEMDEQVDHQVRKQRTARLREILAESSRAYRARFLGEQVQVLWESLTGTGPEGWKLSGISGNYLRVEAVSGRDLRNQLTPVRLTAVTERGVVGEVEEQADRSDDGQG
jgi:threonylcarbamoyladenosine tRNA methylthiotransferase MtaB